MEYIKKEDLIIGEIYKSTRGSHIFKYVDKNGSDNLYCNDRNKFGKKNATVGNGLDNITNATSEEKHWLEECIKADKFIEYDEAMKSFIPEYVECVKSATNTITVGKIYNFPFPIYDDGLESRIGVLDGAIWKFKPSTKEAYDAQFVVKEPEFVLPERWYIKANTKEEADIMYPYFNESSKGTASWSSSNEVMRNKYYARFTNLQYELGVTTNEINPLIPIITFEQFKKYVLKEEIVVEEVIEQPITENKTEMEIWLENTKSLNLNLEDLENYIGNGQTCDYYNIYSKLEGFGSKQKAEILFNKRNEKVIEPLPQFKVIETIETITKVENNEGNQFFIGDVVKSNYSEVIHNIKGFKYNVDKTNILAITEKLPAGINIDKIEHYIEPKVKYSHNFKIGDTIKLIRCTNDYNTYKIIDIIDNVLFYDGNNRFYKNHFRVLAKNTIKVN